jgi:hypothetical protein
MDSLSRLPFLFVFLMVFYVSCTKTNSSANSNGAGIYIVGSNGENPVLWKNGAMQILSPTGGFASQVQVYKNNIYIGGISNQTIGALSNPGGPGGESVYWINGVQKNITALLNPGPTSIAFSGSNFYFDNGYHLYENGSIISLPGKPLGFLASVFVAGSDIYVAGADSVHDVVYWKNQMMHVVEQGFYSTHNSVGDPSVYCLFVSGTDVYMGGSNSGDTAVYWKNGQENPVFGISAINSIFVSGEDLYFTSTSASAYWKNGVEYELPLNGAVYGNATSILVSGTDVYVTGETSEGAVYWKNGVEIILSSAGTANSIYVNNVSQ